MVGLVSHLCAEKPVTMETKGLYEDIIFLCGEMGTLDILVGALSTDSGELGLL